ncbi:pentatricopeptide repeat-containing protein-like [Iris pallida]|uniref:Pentatricopeptide repeat-containing protein-like n=1 Tax=Iris pallida TaxID=29817 RepID=A0AAX6HAA4_IRIPA|nr:pentatricopeptide repeat-containing protein-like [Iris pallida]
MNPSWLKHHCTSVPKCKQAHAYLLRNSLLHDPQLSSKLISFLSLSPLGDLAYADHLFDQLPHRDLFLHNTMLRAHARSPDPSSAFPFLSLMSRSGVAPDHHTFPFALTACARAVLPSHGMALHATTVKLGFSSDLFVLNSLLQMYTACGYFDTARELFNNSPCWDVVTWNVMIKGCVGVGLFREAFCLFNEMVESETAADEVTVMSLVSACSKLGDLDRGKWLHCYSKEHGLLARGKVNLSNAILDMYCKCRDLDSAKELFFDTGAEERDVFTWTAMISGSADCGEFREALELFRGMQREGVRPDQVVLVPVLSVCAQLGALDQGKYVHLLLERFKIKQDVVLETALVDMYAKCGDVELAMQAFETMRERNVFTWNAMIGGLAIHGHGQHALELFARMKHERTVPDDVTFIGLLSACRHSGLVDEGLKLFKEMKQVYAIEPRMEHYGCVVDLFCRAKLVKDALEFIENMPVRSNVVMWASLIGACRVLGDSELAESIGRRAVELEPDTCDRYVMLSNLYAGAGRWDAALEVRDQMGSQGIGKTPGISWIELNGAVHQFVAGDRSHDETDEIYMMVEEMCLRVKSAGHITGTKEVLFNIEEEEKERSLFLHSEKLAVAFGLISTAPGSPIRITKNLRVCTDCHSFLKIVSKVYGREITARDRSRFHHFREGVCSCTDFW